MGLFRGRTAAEKQLTITLSINSLSTEEEALDASGTAYLQQQLDPRRTAANDLAFQIIWLSTQGETRHAR